MYSRVLVPLDGSLPATAALQVGERLADRWGADLQVLTLIEKSQIPAGVNHLIRRQVARIDLKPKVEVRSISYSVAEDIAEEFDVVDDTFVVMSSWARGRTAGLVSNVAEDVFRLVRQPMLLTGPTVEISTDWPDGAMHIAVDGTDFSEAVVRSAALLAKSIAVDIKLVTVVERSAVPAGTNPAVETNALARLATEVEAIVGREVDYDVLHGSDPASEIIDYAKRYGAAAIAMSTHVRSGADRLAHGSITMDVVSHAHCPVLIDRPSIGER
ncbi:MAG: universal stress protein [Acidimicrobiales bacterium]